ncbi:unnamed protein product [Clavelina lepadiformis]|uniref:Uncharacterized protein n=1 Tax=Clavelina lepadiformis TaxID=159417 RepID=A0ABP0FP57_CLALP
MDGLVMLTSIEKRMQELVDEVESLPKSDVNEVRKNKEKQRRLLLREKKLAMELHRQEERARRALERSNANRFKKVGRKLVYRSEPLKSRETAKVSTDRVTKTESQIFLEKE